MSLAARMAIALGVLLLALVGFHLYGEHRHTVGVAEGRAAVMAENALAAASQRQAQDRRDADSADAGNALQLHITFDVPQIQVATHDTRQSIRTFYLARPDGAGQCSRPDSVQAQLDAAIDRANAAARGDLRPHPATGTAAGPAGIPQR